MLIPVAQTEPVATTAIVLKVVATSSTPLMTTGPTTASQMLGGQRSHRPFDHDVAQPNRAACPVTGLGIRIRPCV